MSQPRVQFVFGLSGAADVQLLDHLRSAIHQQDHAAFEFRSQNGLHRVPFSGDRPPSLSFGAASRGFKVAQESMLLITHALRHVNSMDSLNAKEGIFGGPRRCFLPLLAKRGEGGGEEPFSSSFSSQSPLTPTLSPLRRGEGALLSAQVSSCAPQQLSQGLRIAEGAALKVVVEIGPDFFRPAGADFLRPRFQLRVRVIMAIPVVCTMETDINGIGGLDDVYPAGRAHLRSKKSGRRLGTPRRHSLPPTAMAELDGIAVARIELAHD